MQQTIWTLQMTQPFCLIHTNKCRPIQPVQQKSLHQQASTNTKEKATSSSTTRRTPTQSQLMEKLWKRWRLTRTHLGSIIDEQGGSDADVKERVGKANTSFLQLKNMQNSKRLSTNIKVTIFNTNTKTVLLYGAETQRTVTIIIKKVQVLINNCLCKTLNVR